MCFLSFFISSVIYWSDSGLHSVSWVWLGSPGLVVQTVFSQLQFSHVHVLKWVTVQLLHLNSWVIVLKKCWGQHLEGWHWSTECEWRTHWVWSKECNWLMWRLGKVQRVAENKALFGGKTDRTFMDTFCSQMGGRFPSPPRQTEPTRYHWRLFCLFPVFGLITAQIDPSDFSFDFSKKKAVDWFIQWLHFFSEWTFFRVFFFFPQIKCSGGGVGPVDPVICVCFECWL